MQILLSHTPDNLPFDGDDGKGCRHHILYTWSSFSYECRHFLCYVSFESKLFDY